MMLKAASKKYSPLKFFPSNISSSLLLSRMVSCWLGRLRGRGTGPQCFLQVKINNISSVFVFQVQYLYLYLYLYMYLYLHLYMYLYLCLYLYLCCLVRHATLKDIFSLLFSTWKQTFSNHSSLFWRRTKI